MRMMTGLLLATAFTTQAGGGHLLGEPVQLHPVARALSVTLDDTMRFNPTAIRVAVDEMATQSGPAGTRICIGGDAQSARACRDDAAIP